jgi:SAM-dependent methyltransferase
MPLTTEIARIFRCPVCHEPLILSESVLTCRHQEHGPDIEDGISVFARPSVGKYDPGYAARYAALWAFGYVTLNSGLDEGLYRTVSSLVAEALAGSRNAHPIIVDAGCGVGRVTRDCSLLAWGGTVLAFDASPSMLQIAQRIVQGHEALDVELASYGFPHLTIPSFGDDGPIFARADVEDLPLANACADIVLSINIVDRLPHGPEFALRECHRVLRPGGTLVFADPFNWTETRFWKSYPDSASILRLAAEIGFTIETWFDDLRYREVLDARGAFEEFRTLVMAARAKHDT